MIGTSFIELIAIRTSISLLRSITPLSILFTVAIPFIPARFLSPTVKILSVYPICESAFYFLVYLPRKHILQNAAEHPPLRPPEERRALLSRISKTVPDHAAYLRRWFLNAELDEIKVDNVKEFLRWCIFNSSGSWSGEVGGADEETELNEYVNMIEENMGCKLEEGRGSAECYRLTIDEVKMKHRPLLWYFILSFVDFAAFIRLSVAGFTYYRLPLSVFFLNFPFRLETLFTRHTTPVTSLPYWLRPHKSTTKRPILYIHGIGIGLHPYIPTLAELAKTCPDVGIIALELMPISSRICKKMPKREEMIREIRTILSQHPGYGDSDKGFVLVANSYGTVVTTHLLQDAEISKRIAEVILIDPVTILLHLPDVAYNFLRRKPRRANEHMLHYYASTDAGIAHTLCRRFFWAENILWKEDLKGKKARVWLGERDLIVDTASVKRYLTGEYKDELEDENSRPVSGWVDGEWIAEDNEGGKLKVVWGEGLDHAQVFDERKWYTRLVKDIAEASSGTRLENGT